MAHLQEQFKIKVNNFADTSQRVGGKVGGKVKKYFD